MPDYRDYLATRARRLHRIRFVFFVFALLLFGLLGLMPAFACWPPIAEVHRQCMDFAKQWEGTCVQNRFNHCATIRNLIIDCNRWHQQNDLERLISVLDRWSRIGVGDLHSPTNIRRKIDVCLAEELKNQQQEKAAKEEAERKSREEARLRQKEEDGVHKLELGDLERAGVRDGEIIRLVVSNIGELNVPITKVYIAPAGQTNWGLNLLGLGKDQIYIRAKRGWTVDWSGSEALAPYYENRILNSLSAKRMSVLVFNKYDCRFDAKVVYADGYELTRNGLGLCDEMRESGIVLLIAVRLSTATPNALTLPKEYAAKVAPGGPYAHLRWEEMSLANVNYDNYRAQLVGTVFRRLGRSELGGSKQVCVRACNSDRRCKAIQFYSRDGEGVCELLSVVHALRRNSGYDSYINAR